MKKKGLIVSTIVMVVVLVASLTTATYAWFSTNASATVKEINVSTTAAQGLQIALLEKTDTYWSGEVTVGTDGVWDGTEGFGNVIAMSSADGGGFSKIEHASTHAVADSWYLYIVVTANTVPVGATKASLSNDGTNSVDITNGAGLTCDVGNTVYCQYPADMMLTADKYEEGTTTPISYRPSIANNDYLYMPIRLQATNAGIKYVFYKVTITPTNAVDNGIKNTMMPGMAAASRINYGTLDQYTTGTSTLLKHEPFGDWAVVSNAMQKANAQYKNELYIHYGFLYETSNVDGTDTTLTTYTDVMFDVTSWIEGLDKECINSCAGSGFTINIEFNYSSDAAKPDLTKYAWAQKDITNGIPESEVKVAA